MLYFFSPKCLNTFWLMCYSYVCLLRLCGIKDGEIQEKLVWLGWNTYILIALMCDGRYCTILLSLSSETLEDVGLRCSGLVCRKWRWKHMLYIYIYIYLYIFININIYRSTLKVIFLMASFCSCLLEEWWDGYCKVTDDFQKSKWRCLCGLGVNGN